MKRISFLSLSLLLLAGCSSDNEPQSGVNTGQVEIKLTGGIQSVEAVTKGDGVIPSSVPDAGLNINIARLDAINNDVTPSYPEYTSLLSNSVYNAVINKDNSVTFRNTENTANLNLYYLANGYNTKLIGWYPNTGTFKAGATSAPATVQFAIDGSTDVMLSNEPEGNKISKFDGTTDTKLLKFSHQLTRITVEAYQEDSEWGGIESIKIVDEGGKICTITLPSGFVTSIPTTLSDMELIHKTPTDNIDIAYSSDSPLSLFHTAYNNTKPCGYAIFAPTSANTIKLLVKAKNDIESKTVTVTAPSSDGKFKAGTAYTVKLRFSAYTISPSATISPWLGGDTTSTDIQ